MQKTLIFIILCITTELYAFTYRTSNLPSSTYQIGLQPYRPHISNSQEASELFDIIFADDLKNNFLKTDSLLFSLSNHYFLHKNTFGAIGLGGRIGYFKTQNKTRYCPQNIEGCTSSDVLSGESETGNTDTSFTLLPLSFEIYRFYAPRYKLNLPFFIEAKLGLDYHFWWNRVNDQVENRESPYLSGKGGTPGYHTNLLFAFNIDWIDPTLSKSQKDFIGTYLYAEFLFIKGDGFGSDKLDFSDITWSFGLIFDFI